MVNSSGKFYSLIKTNLKYSGNNLIRKEMTTKQLFCFCSFISPKLFDYVSVHLIFPTLLKHSTWTFSLRPPATYTHPSSCSAHKQHSTLPPPLPPHYADGLKRSWGFFFFSPFFLESLKLQEEMWGIEQKHFVCHRLLKSVTLRFQTEWTFSF